MPTDNPAGSDLTALRDALLTHYEEERHGCRGAPGHVALVVNGAVKAA